MNPNSPLTTTLSLFAVKGIMLLIAYCLSLGVTTTLLHILEGGLGDLELYSVHQLVLLHADVLNLIAELTIEVDILRDIMNDIDNDPDPRLAVSPIASVYESQFHVKFNHIQALYRVMRRIEHALSSRNSLGDITPFERDNAFED